MNTARRYTAWFAGGLLLSLVAAELVLRMMGHLPSVIDDRDLWAFHRQRIDEADRSALVLLGGSRIQLGVSLDTLCADRGRKRVIQLAIDGTSPMATLRDLAENSEFSGLVVCSLFEPAFEPANWNAQQPWIDHFHREFAVTSRLKRVFSGTLQRYLVLVNSGKPKYLTTQFDRSRSADYTQVDLTRHRQIRLDVGQRMFQRERASPTAWLAQARLAESYVRAIQRRGGNVVFIRFPSSSPLYQLEERCYPRREYWDRYARVSRATLVHFEDVPVWRRFKCPDLSHLDRSDQIAFTESLVDVLVTRGVWKPASLPSPLARR